MNKLKQWYANTPGWQLAQFESYYINHALHTIFGSHVLHLGELGNKDWLEGSHIRYPVCVTKSGQGIAGLEVIQGTYEQLPVQNASVDIVLLPHILEYEANPQKILAEVWRVLVPHGYAIILGFNPTSLWRLTDLTRHTMNHTRHLLQSEEFAVVDFKTFFFRPPIHNEQWITKLRFMEILGQVLWPEWGAVYLMIARKEVMGITPLHLSVWDKWVGAGYKPAPTGI